MYDELEVMKAQKVAKKVENYKKKIKEIFFETQKLIFTSFLMLNLIKF